MYVYIYICIYILVLYVCICVWTKIPDNLLYVRGYTHIHTYIDAYLDVYGTRFHKISYACLCICMHARTHVYQERMHIKM